LSAEPLSQNKANAWRRARAAIACFFVVAALAFIVRSMAPQLPLFVQAVRNVAWWEVVLAVFAAVPMYVVKAIYHITLLERFSGLKIARGSAVTVYLQSQIVRYLPGKVWGLLYQSGRMVGAIQPGVVVAANLWQMIITNLLALGVVVGVLLWGVQSPAWILLVALTVILIEFLHRWPAVESFALGLFARFFPRLGISLPGGRLPPMSWFGTGMLCAEWVFFFLTFLILLNGKQAAAETIVLGAWYGGASIIALAAFFVPAGIAVREAVFVAAPSVVSLDAGYLMLVAALARIVFFGAEVMAALAGTVWGVLRCHD